MNDGGFAFPVAVHVENPGMTLRDYFAGQALAGMTANPDIQEFIESQLELDRWPDGPRAFAHFAYRIADAMIAEKKNQEEADEHDNGS